MVSLRGAYKDFVTASHASEYSSLDSTVFCISMSVFRLLLERLGHSLFTIFCHPEEHDIDTSFLHCARGALACVKALHEQGYIHRDIKGENFVTRVRKEKFQDENSKKDPGVVLLDYGFVMPIPLARCTTHKYYKKFRGTPETASQRQLQQLPLGPADDLESLAYALLEMYHGKQIWSATALISKSWFPGYDIPALGKQLRCLKQNLLRKTPCDTNTDMEDTETKTALNFAQRRAASAPCMLLPLHMLQENRHTRYWIKQRNTINMLIPPIDSSFNADDLKKQKNDAKLKSPSSHQHHPDPSQPSKDVASTKHAGGAVNERTSQVSIRYTRQDLCTISNRRDAEWKLLMEKGCVPPFLISWLKYCRSLAYTDWPDYRYLENLLESSSGTEVPSSIKETQPKSAICIEDKSTELHSQHKSHSRKTLKRDLMTAFDGVEDYEPGLLQAHQKRRLAEE